MDKNSRASTPSQPPLFPRPEAASARTAQLAEHYQRLARHGEMDYETAQALIAGTKAAPRRLTSLDVLHLIAENERLRRKVWTLEGALRSMSDAWAREILPRAG